MAAAFILSAADLSLQPWEGSRELMAVRDSSFQHSVCCSCEHIYYEDTQWNNTTKSENIKVGAGGKLDFNCRWNYQNLCTQKLKYVHNSNKLQSDMKIQKYQCGRWWIFSIAVFNQGVFFIQREFVCVVFHLFIFFFKISRFLCCMFRSRLLILVEKVLLF